MLRGKIRISDCIEECRMRVLKESSEGTFKLQRRGMREFGG